MFLASAHTRTDTAPTVELSAADNWDVVQWSCQRPLSPTPSGGTQIQSEADSTPASTEKGSQAAKLWAYLQHKGMVDAVSAPATGAGTVWGDVLQRGRVVRVPQELRAANHDDGTILDWEARIDESPLRPRGTIRVKLEYAGRSKPIPAEDPWA